ncbi:MAG: hypothetical protein QXR53_05075 [Candidatus Norongarragalinales archaeon]
MYRYFAQRAKKAKEKAEAEKQEAQQQYSQAVASSQLAENELERMKNELETPSKNVSVATHWPILVIALIAGVVILLIVLKLSKNA